MWVSWNVWWDWNHENCPETSLAVSNLGYRHYNVLSTVKFHFIKIIWCFQAPHSWGQPSNLIIFLAMIIGSRYTLLEFQGLNSCYQCFIHQLLISYHALKIIIYIHDDNIHIEKEIKGICTIISFLFYHVTFHSIKCGCTAGWKQFWKNIVIFMFLHGSLHEYFCVGIFSSTTGTTTRFNSTTNKGEYWIVIKTSLS